MKPKSLANQAGFSLVELMTVVAIMGTLATIAIPRFTSSSDKIRAAQVQTDMTVAASSLSSIHLNGKSAMSAMSDSGIPGASCTGCAQGWSAGTSPSSWSNIAAGDSAWKMLGYSATPIDPWGNPYVLDQNDFEFNDRDCRYDAVYSAGPDGIFSGPGDGDDVFGDDIVVRLPRLPRKAGAFQCPPDDIHGPNGGSAN